jgi:hypothetical protein
MRAAHDGIRTTRLCKLELDVVPNAFAYKLHVGAGQVNSKELGAEEIGLESGEQEQEQEQEQPVASSHKTNL